MPVGMIKLMIVMAFGPPLIACLVALLFADVWLARIDEKKKSDVK